MMKCAICGDEVEAIKARDKHLVVTESYVEKELHVHGDLDNKALMKNMIEAAIEETKVDLKTSGVLDRKEVVFHNRQRIGDMLMFTCAIRDFKLAFPDVRVNVISTAMHIWDHNPHIDRSLAGIEENTVKIGPSKLTNASNRLDWHFANAYRVSIEDALKIHIPQGESRPDIWFTQEEYNAPRIMERPYWIIVVGGEKGWGCKMYPFTRWQEFVDMNQDKFFVQIGAAGDNHPKLQGPNVLDYIGKTEDRNTGVRDLFKLFLNAEGSIGLVSFHMHLSGALHKPAVVIAGAREPVSFTRYPGHRYLATDGCLPCSVTACWHCDINTCKNLAHTDPEKIPKCVDMITPIGLTIAINQYYIGGRLDLNTPSAKPKLKNVVDTPLAHVPVEMPVINVPDVSKYNMTFGGGSITDRDWAFIRETIKKYNVKTVLEFGAGLSTLLLNDLGLRVITFETNQGWINKIKQLNPNTDVRLWNGFDQGISFTEITDRLFEEKHFDLVFVDGPSGGASREISTKIAAASANIVIIHDAGREHERNWQDKYLKGGFGGPVKGGHRCHLWIKAGDLVGPGLKTAQTEPVLSTAKPQTPREVGDDTPQACLGPLYAKNGKFVKIVSTARGWGGCARSVTTIMQYLAQAGHTVEFIPFRNKVSSREYQEFFKTHPEIKVTEDYTTLHESCDVLLMYADDYIWEFSYLPAIETFSDFAACRKIMMLNYRRGPVGVTPWTRDWDKYMFLNSIQERDLLKVHPGVKTKVLPPCVELDEFLMARKESYPLTETRIVRHSSQGDTKFPKDTQGHLDAVHSGSPDIRISMLPGPSWVPETNWFKKYPRTDSPKVIAEFLAGGNLFWYSLPPGYMDMGPRVIIEAMAAGLPILADNWGGAVDRVTPDCGWLCNTKEEQIDIIKNVTAAELVKKGAAARARAIAEFIPERWIEEIVG